MNITSKITYTIVMKSWALSSHNYINNDVLWFYSGPSQNLQLSEKIRFRNIFNTSQKLYFRRSKTT